MAESEQPDADTTKRGRNQEIVDARNRGEKFKDISARLGVSPVRVRQIYLRDSGRLCEFPTCECFEDWINGRGAPCPKGLGRA